MARKPTGRKPTPPAGDEQLDFLPSEPAAPNAAPSRPEPLAAPSPSGLVELHAADSPLRIGTCSFSHEHWNGVFYPAGLPKARELEYYARFHNAVEIDSSFYRVPSVQTAEGWRARAPRGFRFALKAPRSLTHDARLNLADPTARADFHQLLRVLEAMGDALGCVLLQLGPSVSGVCRPALDTVLGELRPRFPVAVEFRHTTWNRPEANELLARHGAVRVWSDHYLDPRRGEREDDPVLWAITGSFGFVRLLGDVSTKYNLVTGELNHRYGGVLFDRGDDLERWAERIRGLLARSIPVYCFINNHYQGFSPYTAAVLRERVGA